MKDTTKFVGLDVSKEKIAVGIADRGREPARYWGAIENSPEALRKLMGKLGEPEELLVCYEAGPTGYVIQRQLQKMGILCIVVAPALIPTAPGDRVKTDRRDALRLAQLLRAGELTPVWVPDEEDEALRDLVRAREDAKEDQLRARHRLLKFLLRHGERAPRGVRRWSPRFREWLDKLHFEHAAADVVFREYLHTLDEIEERIRRLEAAIHEQAEASRRAPVIKALQALRGVAEVTAVTLVAEVGEFSRFRSPRQLMAYAGLVPREHSSGSRRSQGGITKAGNSHVRRIVVEAAWSYRYPPAVKGAIRRRLEGQDPSVQAVSWKAQVRLHHKLRRLAARGKRRSVAVTAVARELLGFVWAIACLVESSLRQAKAA
jgi:transposase